MVYKLFDKKTSTMRVNKFAVGAIKNDMSNKELAEELHRAIIRKFNKRKVN